MRNLSVFIFFLLLTSYQSIAQQPYASAKKVVKLMGCRFEITAIATNDTIAWNAINAGIDEMARIENLISSWKADSQTSMVNQQAGKQAVVVNPELFDLVYRAKKISQLTNGAFDISFASIDRIWNFDGTEQVLPDSTIVQKSASKINWQHIILDTDKQSIYLKEEGMKIGFGAIGKGYAANRAKEIMQAIEGVVGGLVNASGDLTAWGIKNDGDKWKIQIANPYNKDKMVAWLTLHDMAIVTSGDYEKYFTANELRYAHIVNPKTGYPTTGITSVSVICPDAELADALATSIFVLGKTQGLDLVNQLHQIECIIITDDGNITASNGLNLNYY